MTPPSKARSPGSAGKPSGRPPKGKVRVRRWRKADIPRIVECQRAAYPDYPDEEQYGAREFALQLAAFPGRVRPLHDRRPDSYRLEAREQINVIGVE